MRRFACLVLLLALVARAEAQPRPPGGECFTLLGDGKVRELCIRSPLDRPSAASERELDIRARAQAERARAVAERQAADAREANLAERARADSEARSREAEAFSMRRTAPRSGAAWSAPPPAVGSPPASGGPPMARVPMPPAPTAGAPVPQAPPARTAVRALLLPAEMPPPGVPAYGLVAFPTLPLAADRDRFEAVCQAYKSTLVTREQAGSTPAEAQMITFWPITDRRGLDGADPPCGAMVDRYDLKAGLDAIRDADTHRDGLASRRGPFLIAWSPSISRARPDAVLLILDLSPVTSPANFQAIFVTWRQQILDDPKFWRNGFGSSLEMIRLTLRDALDSYGARLVPLFQTGK